MWWHPWCPHPWRPTGFSSYGLWVPYGAVSYGIEPRASGPIRAQRCWWDGRYWTLITLEPRVWRVWRQLARDSPLLLMPLTSALTSSGTQLTPDVLGKDQVWALLFIQPLLGYLLVMEINLGYKNWMVLKQVGLIKNDWAPLVWCVLQWGPGWSVSGHHPGLLSWQWVGLVWQPIW